ncbi:hypothetical protein A8709_17900 [Paenibacillus pectinilyticus]|uniref:Uncharacterized protein n=1 Tax=Paenibacillus pectinilyticus TaxID=512399 RepID=A0A1C0ZZC6_9BACL|nr:phosphotransferase [Paenibacillus pectinilyticus]OCT13478.1 hypothetical protein A8709_17900 [Paenibacillus pectinilyticus]
MDNQKDIIFSDSGEVTNGIPHSKEIIYVGRNGNRIERVRLELKAPITSYIYKPLTNYSSIGKEVWVQEHISSRIPEVRVPQISYYSKSNDPEHYWMVLEDLGEVEHPFGVDVLLKTAELIPYWHRLPKELVPDAFMGHSPLVNELQLFFEEKSAVMKPILEKHGFTSDELAYIYGDMLTLLPFESETVISHGDLYPLNIAEIDHELIIFDWEYIHKNSVFWDLYSLMDITSPQYRRPVLDQTSRIDVLTRYLTARQKLEFPTKLSFIRDYHTFSALYTLWLLVLIEGDLAHDKHDRSALLQQQQESIGIMKALLNYLMSV